MFRVFFLFFSKIPSGTFCSWRIFVDATFYESSVNTYFFYRGILLYLDISTLKLKRILTIYGLRDSTSLQIDTNCAIIRVVVQL